MYGLKSGEQHGKGHPEPGTSPTAPGREALLHVFAASVAPKIVAISRSASGRRRNNRDAAGNGAADTGSASSSRRSSMDSEPCADLPAGPGYASARLHGARLSGHAGELPPLPPPSLGPDAFGYAVGPLPSGARGQLPKPFDPSGDGIQFLRPPSSDVSSAMLLASQSAFLQPCAPLAPLQDPVGWMDQGLSAPLEHQMLSTTDMDVGGKANGAGKGIATGSLLDLLPNSYDSTPTVDGTDSNRSSLDWEPSPRSLLAPGHAAELSMGAPDASPQAALLPPGSDASVAALVEQLASLMANPHVQSRLGTAQGLLTQADRQGSPPTALMRTATALLEIGLVDPACMFALSVCDFMPLWQLSGIFSAREKQRRCLQWNAAVDAYIQGEKFVAGWGLSFLIEWNLVCEAYLMESQRQHFILNQPIEFHLSPLIQPQLGAMPVRATSLRWRLN